MIADDDTVYHPAGTRALCMAETHLRCTSRSVLEHVCGVLILTISWI
jgi:hypothetical protein